MKVTQTIIGYYVSVDGVKGGLVNLEVARSIVFDQSENAQCDIQIFTDFGERPKWQKFFLGLQRYVFPVLRTAWFADKAVLIFINDDGSEHRAMNQNVTNADQTLTSEAVDLLFESYGLNFDEKLILDKQDALEMLNVYLEKGGQRLDNENFMYVR